VRNGWIQISSYPSEQVRVIVIAATNRRSILDPAILRPGRFDRHVVIPPHARNARMSNAVDLVFLQTIA